MHDEIERGKTMAVKISTVCIYTTFMDGLLSQPAKVEVSVTPGLPTFDVLGLCDSSIREARGRIAPALVSGGFEMPKGHITASISPSYLKKSGTGFDLPIALGMLIASGQLNPPGDSVIYSSGEVMLDGSVRGTPSAALRLQSAPSDCDYAFIPEEETDAARCSGLEAMAITHLSTLKKVFNGGYSPVKYSIDDINEADGDIPDFSSLKGQEKAMRALLIAAAGVHNILLLGSPGCGKTMAGKILAGIMPPLSGPEIGDVYSIMEAAGLRDDPEEGLKLSSRRPFRYIYPGMSRGRILGVPSKLLPGELALANHGVLFADEIFEYKSEIIEALRVPLEDHVVRMTREGRNYAFPAQFVFVAAGNPCKCGMLYEDGRRCTCTPRVINNYMARLSGPVRDRIDLVAEMRSISGSAMENSFFSESEQINSRMKAQVRTAWQIQKSRFNDGIYNGTCVNADAELFRADRATVKYAADTAEKLGFSARGFNRLLRVGRTIADLDERSDMRPSDIGEAGIYRKGVISNGG